MRTKILGVLTMAAMIPALYGAFVYAPTEREQGIAQRIFYFHVPCGILSYLAAAVVFYAAVRFLVSRDLRWDRLAYSAAELGVLFAGLSLVTGMIWAKPIWGVWWRWDARLTLQLLLWLIFVAYFMLRAYLPDRNRRARLASIFGLLGMLDVPFNYLSIRLWEGQHPAPIVGGGEGAGMEPEMWTAFILANVAMLLLF
ncbi:MAG TPA: cytochrome c biogenesis protein CcsA, partial [Terriglobia bacterium]|nr:cytochrome c biogenesis protein CcsA [Terriglobia bacterium]